MSDEHVRPTAPDAQHSEQLEQVVSRFESAWRSGQQPKVDDFLPEAGELLMACLGRMLVAQGVLVILMRLGISALQWSGVTERRPYWIVFLIGSASLFVPVYVFRWRQGAMTELERQLTQVWCIIAVAMLVTVLLNKSIPGATGGRAYPRVMLEGGIGFGCTAVLLGGSLYPAALTCVLLAGGKAWAPTVTRRSSGSFSACA